MIDRALVANMFVSIAREGRWDMTQPMLWGYFFTHSRPDKLRAVVSDLQAIGYEFVDVFEAEREPGTAELWLLHVQKVEVHSVDTLNARNEQLTEFAAKH